MIASAFFLGLLGSLHCVGMCGPLALSLPLERSTKIKLVFESLIYNSGRIVTYMLLGAVLGLLGQGFFVIGFQNNFESVVFKRRQQ